MKQLLLFCEETGLKTHDLWNLKTYIFLTYHHLVDLGEDEQKIYEELLLIIKLKRNG